MAALVLPEDVYCRVKNCALEFCEFKESGPSDTQKRAGSEPPCASHRSCTPWVSADHVEDHMTDPVACETALQQETVAEVRGDVAVDESATGPAASQGTASTMPMPSMLSVLPPTPPTTQKNTFIEPVEEKPTLHRILSAPALGNPSRSPSQSPRSPGDRCDRDPTPAFVQEQVLVHTRTADEIDKIHLDFDPLDLSKRKDLDIAHGRAVIGMWMPVVLIDVRDQLLFVIGPKHLAIAYGYHRFPCQHERLVYLSKELCKYHQRGYCRSGQKCQFMHSTPQQILELLNMLDRKDALDALRSDVLNLGYPAPEHPQGAVILSRNPATGGAMWDYAPANVDARVHGVHTHQRCGRRIVQTRETKIGRMVWLQNVCTFSVKGPQGRCTYGAHCRFDHLREAQVEEVVRLLDLTESYFWNRRMW